MPATPKPIPKLDRVATLKMSAAQIRQCKAAARSQGMRFSVWARTVLLANADRVMGPNGGSVLEAPKIPKVTAS